MKNYILAFFFLACWTVAISQTTRQRILFEEKAAICGGGDSILARKGNWKKVEDAFNNLDKSFPKSQDKLLNNRIDSIGALFKQTITDTRGFEPRWYRSSGRTRPYTVNGPMPYVYTALFFNYYCNEHSKKIFLGDETYNWTYVFVNHYNWFCKWVGDWDYKGDGRKIMIFTLPPKVGTWKGRTLYAPLTHPPFARAVVIGHNGKLPWRSLTQKEYLAGLRSYYEEQRIKQPGAYVDEYIGYIDKYLQSAKEETLNQPAVVPPKNAIGFKGKFEDEENGGSRVIVFSSSYWDEKLPRYVPQFMIIYWRWTDEVASEIGRKQFEENFPLEKLKALLDK